MKQPIVTFNRHKRYSGLCICIALVITLLCFCSNKAGPVKLTREKFREHYEVNGTNTVKLIKGEYGVDIVIPAEIICEDVQHTVTEIGPKAFKGYLNLSTVEIPSSVTKISYDAFRDCTSLLTINIPKSVKTIGHNTFTDCTGLTSVTLPDSITEIGFYSFKGCGSLTSVVIPELVRNIADGSFWGCKSLSNIILPARLTRIGSSVFKDCTALTAIHIPDSIKEIGMSTFENCENLATVTIPTTVKSIRAKAFSGCSTLTSINMPHSVTSISDDAFTGCDNLSSESAAVLKTRMREAKAKRVQVVTRYPETVYSVLGFYANGTSTPVWKWSTTFSAKNNTGAFKLKSNTYFIKNGMKTWNPGWDMRPDQSVSVEKGKSVTVTREFHGEDFRGGYFERTWSGEDEYGNHIQSFKEHIKLK